MKPSTWKIISNAVTVIGMVTSLISGFCASKQMEVTIQNEVQKALAEKAGK